MSVERRWRMPIPRPYVLENDVKPVKLDYHSDNIPKSHRTLSKKKRYGFKENFRQGLRLYGGNVRVDVDLTQLRLSPTVLFGKSPNS
ncbi:MAG: hypothetical protein HYT07_03855 [Candidatus Levybacteria bacterium]|nr:hypothetical protein [Candidatus Levybacteria bacterium]